MHLIFAVRNTINIYVLHFQTFYPQNIFQVVIEKQSILRKKLNIPECALHTKCILGSFSLSLVFILHIICVYPRIQSCAPLRSCLLTNYQEQMWKVPWRNNSFWSLGFCCCCWFASLFLFFIWAQDLHRREWKESKGLITNRRLSSVVEHNYTFHSQSRNI